MQGCIAVNASVHEWDRIGMQGMCLTPSVRTIQFPLRCERYPWLFLQP